MTDVPQVVFSSQDAPPKPLSDPPPPVVVEVIFRAPGE